ncbi:heavy-metal-associated domain-containing protein [Aridibaculum aurantiacum]|uniref:heavy-metal-associated domain-containing protein n=1 Tax=Aridibaculum aurantiacum TaxID=2810307 RepID=UPI001A966BEF|nr:copper chaperone [Aridibaculum aurantiacum]
MKTLQVFIAFIFSVVAFSANAQTNAGKKETVKVYGNCGMCKSRIEKAAVAAGASTATYNYDTKVLAVTIADEKTSMEQIEKAVAAVGHDTKNFTAPEEAYKKLHGCCKYDRKAAGSKE